jgi:proteasome lid subunit RPN8/RPN11
MSETIPPIRALPSPRLQEKANAILQQIRDGGRNATITLPLPDGRPEIWLTVSSGRVPFLGRGLRVSLGKSHPYCQRCRQTIEKLRGQETQAGIADLLQEVISTIQSCNCAETTSPAMGSLADGQVQTPPRIHSAGSRVKVISTSDPVVPAPTVQETAQLTKSKGVMVVGDGAEETAEGRSVEEYTAPSIRFRPSSKVLVEVTIPRYVCEALVHHCHESNRHNREVGGILVGYQGETQDEDSKPKTYTNVITDLIRFKPSDSSGASLHLNADSWVHVSNIYEEKYQPWKKVRLGWYHTHPTQGIFFSTLDHDFHTNFNQPFQFAIVVNPRSMEAGLIYWKSYENRVTEGPITFSLRRQNETNHSVGGTSSGPPEDRREPLAWMRILFFACVSLAVLGYVAAHSQLFSVSPSDACLLALNVLLGLRLLNANFFRPKERIEDKSWAALREWLWIAVDRLALAYERHPGIAFIGMLIVVILLAMLLILKAIWPTPRTQATLQNQAGIQAGSVRGSPPSQQQGDGRVYLTLINTGQTLSLSPSQGTPRVTYHKMLNDQWEPTSLEEEQGFLSQVLKLNASVNRASDDVRIFQQHLYGRTRAGRENPADGIWGRQTRNALLEKLIQAQKARKEWLIPWAEEQPRYVVISEISEAGTSADDRSSAQVNAHAMRRPRRVRRR